MSTTVACVDDMAVQYVSILNVPVMLFTTHLRTSTGLLLGGISVVKTPDTWRPALIRGALWTTPRISMFTSEMIIAKFARSWGTANLTYLISQGRSYRGTCEERWHRSRLGLGTDTAPVFIKADSRGMCLTVGGNVGCRDPIRRSESAIEEEHHCHFRLENVYRLGKW
jgi:hypothetical protein